jgi:hypothetical protein
MIHAGAHARDESSSLELTTCAAYYFLNSHVSQMTDYERLYQAGERALNLARMLADRETVQADFDRASTDMMELMNHDWLNFGRIEARFGASCEALLSSDPIRRTE